MKHLFDSFLKEDKPSSYKTIAYQIDRAFSGFLSDNNTAACNNIIKDVMFCLDKSKRNHHTGKVSVLYDLAQKCLFTLRQYKKNK